MSHDHVHDDPELAEILRGDHFHDTPDDDALKLVADWWAMIVNRVPAGRHVLHLVPLDTDEEDDIFHVEFTKTKGGSIRESNDLLNWLHMLPLYMAVGNNDVLVSLTVRTGEITPSGEEREQERIWLFLPGPDMVEFSALEAEEFFEEQSGAPATEHVAGARLQDDNPGEPGERLVMDSAAWDELQRTAEAEVTRRKLEASVIAHYEAELGDVRVPDELNGLFRDAWVLDDFLNDEEESGKRAARFVFKRFVGPVELYEKPRIQDRPVLRKTARNMKQAPGSVSYL